MYVYIRERINSFPIFKKRVEMTTELEFLVDRIVNISLAVEMKYICEKCYDMNNGIKHTKGSFFIEIVLWLCFFVPGVIYSIWRLSTRGKVCKICKEMGLIPLNTPRGKMLLEQSEDFRD